MSEAVSDWLEVVALAARRRREALHAANLDAIQRVAASLGFPTGAASS
jgi:hypothetical protein